MLRACEAGMHLWVSLQSGRKHKAWGAQAPGSLKENWLSPHSRAGNGNAIYTWGLRPRLYASTRFAG